MKNFNEWKNEFLKQDYSHKYLTRAELDIKYHEYISTFKPAGEDSDTSDLENEEVELGYSNGWLTYLRTIYGLQFLGTVFVASIFASGFTSDADVFFIVIATIYLVFFFSLSVGILGCRKWARTLCYVHSFIMFVAFPIGTAIGVLNIIALSKTENAFK